MDLDSLSALALTHRESLLLACLVAVSIPFAFWIIDFLVSKAGDFYSFLVTDTARLQALKAARRPQSEDFIQ